MLFFTSRLITQENVAARRKSNDNISQSRKEKTPELNKEKTSSSKENTPQFKKERTPQPRKEKNPSPSKEKIPDCKTTPPKEKTLPPKEETPKKEADPQFKQDNALEKENSSQNSLLENIDWENKNSASQPKMSDEEKAETKEVTPQSTEVKLVTGSKKSGPMDHLLEVSAISASLSCNLPPTRP